LDQVEGEGIVVVDNEQQCLGGVKVEGLRFKAKGGRGVEYSFSLPANYPMATCAIRAVPHRVLSESTMVAVGTTPPPALPRLPSLDGLVSAGRIAA
jgi:hypothetical protein